MAVTDEQARLFEWIVRGGAAAAGGGDDAARGEVAARGGEDAARGDVVGGGGPAARGDEITARGDVPRGDAVRGDAVRGAASAGAGDGVAVGEATDGRLPALVAAFTAAQAAGTTAETARLVREHGLPREAVKPEHLDDAEVWAALLERMPMTALLRNLATLTRVGVIAPGSYGTDYAAEQLADAERLRKARVHPIAVLSAMRTYASGRGVRGRHTWAPVGRIVDALDAAFYTAFGNVEPANARMMLALDVSGSMTFGEIAGVPGLTPRDASAALALVTAATEPRYEIVGFTGSLTPLAISPRQRLTDAVKAVSDLPFGSTDCALPMRYALAKGYEIDTFVIYTDSETWYGDILPVQALREYRERTGIAARLVVVGMVANRFTIADPEDPGMLDIVGFDAATPEVVSGFARGVV
ncbi:TROVE domain-containing protein [Solirubrobacter sp. CPCC 204708]|nr:TROVE domain-containing protein [Solirubrobacter deserti]